MKAKNWGRRAGICTYT